MAEVRLGFEERKFIKVITYEKNKITMWFITIVIINLRIEDRRLLFSPLSVCLFVTFAFCGRLCFDERVFIYLLPSHSAEGYVLMSVYLFICLYVCLFVIRITQKVLNRIA